ncbi:MAG TPA: hypothetical protein VE153_22920, partial [Myxococcus sp.]|nr:hypothetical protein [Myxococcus sp.]
MPLPSDPLEAQLLEALPPLHQRIRHSVVEALAQRLQETPRPHGPGDVLPLWLHGALQSLVAEVAAVEAESLALIRRYHEAQDSEARRDVLVAYLTETVKDRKERREDIRALDRWLGLDALRERLEKKRHQLLVQEETALRCLTGLLPRLNERLVITHADQLRTLTGELLARTVDAPRPQNRLAALECFHALVCRVPQLASALPEAGATLTGL